jgi:hypothetical protein
MKDAVTGLGISVCEKRYYDFTTNQIESNLKIPDQHATMPLTENRGYKNNEPGSSLKLKRMGWSTLQNG